MNNCEICIHEKVCGLKLKYKDCQVKVDGLIDELGEENVFELNLKCPEYQQKHFINTGITDKPEIWRHPWINEKRDGGLIPNISYELASANQLI